MKPQNSSRSQDVLIRAKRTATVLLAFCLIALVGCGSTKVYTADKTILYRDSLYNMSNVQRVSAREDVKLTNGDVVNTRNMDKKQIEALIKENEKVLATMAVEMDEKEMIYLRAYVEKYSEYSRMKSRFDSAMKDISKFMGDKKKTQLNLK